MHKLIQFMSRRFAVTAAMLIVLVGAQEMHAQIQLGLSTDRERYLVYEPVKLTVSLRNYSGNRLVFSPVGGQDYKLMLQITDSQQLGAKDVDVSHLLGGVVFGAGETKQLTINVNDVVNLQEPRQYTVYAEVEHEALPRVYPSNEVSFDVRDGHEAWSRRVGIPRGDDATSGKVTEREIKLIVLQERASQIYCLQIADKNFVYRVVRLGKRIFGSQPQVDTDAVSNVHILLRLKSRLFVYKVFDYNGKQKQEKYIAVDGQAPRLYRDGETGRVTVLGGRPAKEGVDYVLQSDDARVSPYTDIKDNL